MWSDNETDIDYLGFEHLIAAVARIVRDPKLLPATIGVYGDWGSGKSSLLRMVRKELEKSGERIAVLYFNGWLFEGYEDAKVALMGSILDELRSNEVWYKKGGRTIQNLARRVNWMRALGIGAKYGAAFLLAGPAGLGLAAAAEGVSVASQIGKKAADLDLDEAGQLLKEDGAAEARKAVREFREEFGKLLGELELDALVVVIDDLDRCLPATIIETLEAIKLFLFVPKTAFIIGADERLVRYAVRHKFPELPGEHSEVGREYLEKLVQFPVRIPPLTPSELETYMNFLFASRARGLLPNEFETARQAALKEHAKSVDGVRFTLGAAKASFQEVPDALATELSLSHRLAPVLAAGLTGNPRQSKRFLNMLMMRIEMAEARSVTLKQRVLAKLMVLEYLKPEWFKQLAGASLSTDGRIEALTALERAVRPQAEPPSRAANDDGEPLTEPTPRHSLRSQKVVEPVARMQDEGESVIPTNFSSWTSDQWMRDWLLSEPSLADEDIRPYFYFARDILVSLGTAVRRMSPQAQDVLGKLIHESRAQRQNAVKQCTKLSPADAAAVFEAMSERVMQADDVAAPLDVTFELVKTRGELLSQLLALLARMPENRVPASATLKLSDAAKGTPSEPAATEQLQKWSRSGQSTLAQSASIALSRKLPKA